MTGKVIGLAELIAKLRQMPRSLRLEVVQFTEYTGRTIQLNAQRNAPVDTGKLRQSIAYEATRRGYGAMVSVNVPYGPYVEFGTGGLVEVPEGFEDIASQFKGAGKRQVNLPARPYLIPAYLVGKKQYYEGLEKILRRITK